MKIILKIKRSLHFFGVIILAACGGGSDSPSTNNPVNAAPVITLNDAYNISENVLATGVLLNLYATDPEQDNISISLGQEADSGVFSIDTNTSELVFNTAPDFETPTDSDSNNSYQVSVVYIDSKGASASKLVDINVSDQADIEMAMTFPTPNANLGGATEVTVKGTLIDNEDNLVLSTDVSVVTVNGVEATLFNDNTMWSATLPISGQEINLAFEVTNADELVFTNTKQLINTPQLRSFEAPYDGVFDSENNRLIVLDSLYDAVMALNLDTLELNVLSDKNIGDGINFENIIGMAFDSANNRIFVSDISLNIIFEVNLNTGDRAVLSGDGIGGGASLISPFDLNYDSINEELYLVDLGLDALIKINVNTGDRVIISDDDTGSGESFDTPSHLVVDATNNVAYIADQASFSIFKVNLITGDRTIITDSVTGDGPYLPNSYGVYLSLDKNSLFVIGDSQYLGEPVAVIEINLTTLTRSIVSNSEFGSGANMDTPRGIISDGIGEKFWILDIGIESVFVIDLITGNREILDSPNSNNNFLDPNGIIIDKANKRLLVTDTNTLYTVDISDTETSGNISVLSNSEIGTGPSLVLANYIAFDEELNRAFIVSDNENSEEVLLSIDLTTGNRSQVVEFNTFINNGSVGNIVFDSTNNRILYIESAGSDKLVSIDLSTFEFTEISDLLTIENPSSSFTRGLTLNTQNTIAYVVDGVSGIILSVNLSSGATTIVSSANKGTGPLVANTSDIIIDTLNNRLLVTDTVLEQVISVDITTGDRAVLSDSTLNVPFGFTSDMTLDSENNRLFLSDFFEDNIFVIDLETGERAFVTH